MAIEPDRIALALMARAPRPGATKTRLSPPLTGEEAAELYRCMLLDKIEQATQLQHVDLWIAYASPEDEPFFRANAPKDTKLLLQRGADLGERMHNIAADLLRSRVTGVMLTGTDLPVVDNLLLSKAMASLRERTADVVIGPSADGGYYLIGLSALNPRIFANVEWSTNRVLEQTVTNAGQAGMSVLLLDKKYDVDNFADLERLAVDLDANPALAPRTSALLKLLGERFGQDRS